MKQMFFLVIAVALFSCGNMEAEKVDVVPIPEYRQPGNYVCLKTDKPLRIDGVISNEEWSKAEWSDWFRDIEGEGKADPRFKTRMKMLWDQNYLYVAAELEEPHVWAKITQRDEVIFYDNDFEVFIDPDDDTHGYYELEVNAFGTAWDLLLPQPYRDGGPAIDSWDIQGLMVGTDIRGTINNPNDIDEGWTVEIAIPFSVLEEYAPGGEMPDIGDQWRINFSRVEWKVEVKDGVYEKLINPETGKSYPEDNWVWSPQGYINMHMPEHWGYVRFAGSDINAEDAKFELPTDFEARWILRNLYYRQFQYNEEKGSYAQNLDELGWPVEELKNNGIIVEMDAGKYGYQAYIDHENEIMIINEKGKISKR